MAKLQIKTDTQQVYLLRCWQEQPAGPQHKVVWRFSLQTVGNQNPPHGLVSLGALLDFLQAQLAADRYNGGAVGGLGSGGTAAINGTPGSSGGTGGDVGFGSGNSG